MADFIEPGPVSDTAGIREAVCIHTRKIFDSCREKDLAPLRKFSGSSPRLWRRGDDPKLTGF